MNHYRYAVICAAHTGNAGMYSVDAAAKHFFDAHGADYDLYVAQKDRKGNFSDYGLVSHLHDLDSYTHIVYWGDFLNNPAYGYQDYARRSQKWGLAASHAEGVAQWKRVFSPRRPIPGVKIYSVGSNFQHNFNEVTPKAAHLLKRIERVFDGVYLRDSFSYQNLSRHFRFENMSRVHLGMDCAFLQKPRLDVDPAEHNGTFSYYFKRSKLKNTARLVRVLEESTGLRGVELKDWIPLPRGEWHERFSALKSQIDQSSCVITDTYHVGVNAMQSRRPLVGLGRAQREQEGTLGDFKKKVLFRMFDLERFYYEIDDDGSEADALEAIVDKVHATLDEFRAGKAPYALLDARTREFQRNLERELSL